jgi:hypothetical protein
VKKWPTPTSTERSGVNPKTGKGAGLSKEVQRWPTPKTGSNRNSRQAIVDQKGGGKHKSDLSLEQAVEVEEGILPRELKDPEELPLQYKKRWPTPIESDSRSSARHTTKKGKSHPGTSLTDAVNLFPTPSATDYKGAGKTGQLRDRLDYAAERGATKKKNFATPQHRDYRSPEGNKDRWNDPNRSQNLNDQIGGQLNPTWVEWLMGYPLEWTVLKD